MATVTALSEQQIVTLYGIGTFLTVVLLGVILAGVLGILHRRARVSAGDKAAWATSLAGVDRPTDVAEPVETVAV